MPFHAQIENTCFSQPQPYLDSTEREASSHSTHSVSLSATSEDVVIDKEINRSPAVVRPPQRCLGCSGSGHACSSSLSVFSGGSSGLSPCGLLHSPDQPTPALLSPLAQWLSYSHTRLLSLGTRCKVSKQQKPVWPAPGHLFQRSSQSAAASDGVGPLSGQHGV